MIYMHADINEVCRISYMCATAKYGFIWGDHLHSLMYDWLTKIKDET